MMSRFEVIKTHHMVAAAVQSGIIVLWRTKCVIRKRYGENEHSKRADSHDQTVHRFPRISSDENSRNALALRWRRDVLHGAGIHWAGVRSMRKRALPCIM